MRIAVLCAVFNRRDVTVRGIGLLVEALELANVEPEIFILDDRSSDGTALALAERYPQVHIRHGNGKLYWNRGMCAAYEASKAFGTFDAYLLFNDDVVLRPSAVDAFITEYCRLNLLAPHILVGSTKSADDGSTTYSAYREISRLQALGFAQIGEVAENTACDAFNGNFVLVPGRFFVEIGGLDSAYHHGLGDIDLGLVARGRNIPSILFPLEVGYCEKGPSIMDRVIKADFQTRWNLLFRSPNGIGPYAHFVWKHRPRLLFPAYLVWTLVSRLKAAFGFANQQ